MDWNYEIRSFSVAVRRFWRHTATNHKMLALMLLAVTSLICVVIYYHSDKRLSNGPWSTYEDGMFSVNEPRNEDFELFKMNMFLYAIGYFSTLDENDSPEVKAMADKGWEAIEDYVYLMDTDKTQSAWEEFRSLYNKTSYGSIIPIK